MNNPDYADILNEAEAIVQLVITNHRGNQEEAEDAAEEARMAYRERVCDRGWTRLYNNIFVFDSETADLIPDGRSTYDVAVNNIPNIANRVRHCVEYDNRYDECDDVLYWSDVGNIPTVLDTDEYIFGELVEREMERQEREREHSEDAEPEDDGSELDGEDVEVRSVSEKSKAGVIKTKEDEAAGEAAKDAKATSPHENNGEDKKVKSNSSKEKAVTFTQTNAVEFKHDGDVT